jgi:hypothetical protein
MALLTPGQRELAQSRGLIRPDVSRDALLEFRKEIEAVQPRESKGISSVKMRAELLRLERQRRKAVETLLVLRRRIREIRDLLEPAQNQP